MSGERRFVRATSLRSSKQRHRCRASSAERCDGAQSLAEAGDKLLGPRCREIGPGDNQSSTSFRPQPLFSGDYFANHPTGKQLALIMSLPLERPALYIDADVLFFPGAVVLADLLRNHDAPALYLRDCHVAGDELLLLDPAEAADPVNTGALFLFRKLDWSLAIERLQKLEGVPNFFTNQTMTHLTMHANGARPRDRSKFILQLDDQFQLADRYANNSIVLRHYVNPVRHKFWEQIFS